MFLMLAAILDVYLFEQKVAIALALWSDFNMGTK